MNEPLPDLPPPAPSPAPETDPHTHVQKVVVVANGRAALERKRSARLRLTLIVAGVAVVGIVVWGFERFSSAPLAKVASFESQVTSAVQQGFSSFPPQGVTSAGTKSPKTAAAKPASTVLTIEGVIADTNAARAASGTAPLAESQTLDAIATLRLDDMFMNQYFAHVDPATGESAITVASSVGYNHLALGENLAEGMFAGDQGVVSAWMNSPGHRANILDTHYTEIGVAAREGTFQGQQEWIAVQVFGKPTSACPAAPDPVLQNAINAAETALTDMETELAEEKASIDAMQPQSGSAYNDRVSQYNTIVGQYNALAAQTKTEVNQYNGEVDAYNACL